MANLLSLDNKVFASYVFYAAVVMLKLFGVVFLVIYNRVTLMVLPSEEDYGTDPKKEKQPGIKTHPDVERVRRMHQNDLENIPLFVILGLLYVLTNPPHATAVIVFRVFTAARVIHSFAYFFAVFNVRGPSFLVGLLCNIYLAVNVLLASKFAY